MSAAEGQAVPSPPEEEVILDVRGLHVGFRHGDGWHEAVKGVDMVIRANEVVGLVGESGSGKTMFTSGAMGLAQAKGGRVRAERIDLLGHDVRSLSQRAWSDIRGRDVGMIFQQPIRSLNPAFTVGAQIAQAIRRHTGLGRKASWRRAVEMLDRVHIADADRRAREYPHTFSGGMCQRVMIAMALSCSPKLLIADEPTTALDVTVQSRILDLLREVQADTGVAVLFITHDLGVISDICERVVVMYAGEVVEEAPVDRLFGEPQHPYTASLLACIPRVGQSRRLGFIPGVVPGAGVHVPGCGFARRCAHAQLDRCDVAPIEMTREGDRAVRCIRWEEGLFARRVETESDRGTS